MSKQSDIVKVSQGAAGDPLYVDSANNRVGVGTSSPSGNLHVYGNSTVGSYIFLENTDGSTRFQANNDSIFIDAETHIFRDSVAGGSGEYMRIDASGNLLINQTSISDYSTTAGSSFRASGFSTHTADANTALMLNRLTSDGNIIELRRDGTIRGVAGISGSYPYFGGTDTGLRYDNGSNGIFPFNCGELSYRDNVIDLGFSGSRFNDIYATNGTIQTSDRNEKQDIAELTVAEITAAKAISKLFKTFKWNSSVEEKGEAARIHSGVIAQDVEQAMTDAGLDAGRYAFFISSTWWELDGQTYENAEEAPEGAVEKNRKGIRYPQLLSFVGAATEQRLASIESRLDALEGN